MSLQILLLLRKSQGFELDFGSSVNEGKVTPMVRCVALKASVRAKAQLKCEPVESISAYKVQLLSP